MRRFATMWLAVLWIVLLVLDVRAAPIIIQAPAIPPDGSTIIIMNGALSAPGGITIQGDTNTPGAFLRRSTTNSGYQLEYSPGAITSFVALTEYFPMKLVSYSTGLWYAATRIYPYQTNYPDFSTGTNMIYPVPGVHPQWVQFARNGNDGSQGAQGVSGVNGADGVGNINYSIWSSTFGYSSNTPTVVSYAGQWYDLIAATSSNQAPTSFTSVWAISVAKGTGGTILGTNIVLRGAYDAGYTYTTNDGVSYNGSSFYIGPTNVALGAGNAPSGSTPPSHTAMWTVLAEAGAAGAQGATGPQGPSGAVVTNINNYTYYFTNQITSVVYIDSATNMVRVSLTNEAQLDVCLTNGTSGGPQTPWTDTIDGAGNQLIGVGSMIIASNNVYTNASFAAGRPSLLIVEGTNAIGTNIFPWAAQGVPAQYPIVVVGDRDEGGGTCIYIVHRSDEPSAQGEFSMYRTSENGGSIGPGWWIYKNDASFAVSNGYTQGGYMRFLADQRAAMFDYSAAGSHAMWDLGLHKLNSDAVEPVIRVLADGYMGIGITNDIVAKIHVYGHSNAFIRIDGQTGYQRGLQFAKENVTQWRMILQTNAEMEINSEIGNKSVMKWRPMSGHVEFGQGITNTTIYANFLQVTGRYGVRGFVYTNALSTLPSELVPTNQTEVFDFWWRPGNTGFLWDIKVFAGTNFQGIQHETVTP